MAKTKAPKTGLSQDLRDAIRKSGTPLLTIAKETGVEESTISEFMAGGDVRLGNARKIAAYLGGSGSSPQKITVRVTREPAKKRTMKKKS